MTNPQTRRRLLSGIAASAAVLVTRPVEAAIAVIKCEDSPTGGAVARMGGASAYLPLLETPGAAPNSAPRITTVEAVTAGPGQDIRYRYHVVFPGTGTEGPVNRVIYQAADFSEDGKVTFTQPVANPQAYRSDVTNTPVALTGVDFDWGRNGKIKIQEEVREWQAGAARQVDRSLGRCKLVSPAPNR